MLFVSISTVKKLSSASVSNVKNYKPKQKSARYYGLRPKSVVKLDCHHLKNISRKAGPCFLFSGLDYSNSVFTGLPKRWIRQLQSSQKSGLYHSTPEVSPLASCPLKSWFKNTAVTLKSFKWLHLSSSATIWTSGRQEQVCFLSSELELNTEKLLSVYESYMWNKRPDNCRSALTLAPFKANLNTFLFTTVFD